jgi:BirA family biotin operon repressor/biotin-[acetyl-CoA-carboxylase] ligase
MPLIDIPALQQILGPLAARLTVAALDECASTNALLIEAAGKGAPSGSVVVADRQTEGYGRRGRAWISSPKDSLTFSLLWHWRKRSAHLSGLSLGIGLALALGLESLGIRHLGLKWPNDLLCQQPEGYAKLAGVLVELVDKPHRMEAVIGVGLNLRAPPVMEQPVAGLADCCARIPGRHELLAALLKELVRILDIFEAQGFAVLRQSWESRHLCQNQPVYLLEDNRLLAEGICRGVDKDGALFLETSSGLERFMAGDLSLRAGTKNR